MTFGTSSFMRSRWYWKKSGSKALQVSRGLAASGGSPGRTGRCLWCRSAFAVLKPRRKVSGHGNLGNINDIDSHICSAANHRGPNLRLRTVTKL
jgi:hypothetical protein